MPIKNLTLGLCLLLAGQALAKNQTHTVRKGESISAIAVRFGTSQKAILSANGLRDKHKLRLGQRLIIPIASSHKDGGKSAQVPTSKTVKNGSKSRVHGADAAKAAASVRSGNYVVQAGDNDQVIAHKLGTTVSTIHRLNPKAEWHRLQVGQKLAVPGAKPVVVDVPEITSRFAKVAKDSVIVRSHPNRSSAAIVTVSVGSKASIQGRDGDWYRVKLDSGIRGWVRGDMLKAAKEPKQQVLVAANEPSDLVVGKGQYYLMADTAQEKVLKTASSYRGVRYRWGGTSRSGVDCSGFTTQVFRAQGVKLPRTAAEQARVGTKVTSDLQAGDLVFFRTTRTSRISHVGIYIGKGKFIHASSGGGKVQIDSLRQGYYRSRFVAARRIVKSWKGTPIDRAAHQIVEESEPVAIVAESSESASPIEAPLQGADQVAR